MLTLLAIALQTAAAPAVSVTVSPGPERVAVTLYRDPNRPAEQRPDLQWLNGVALISEVRRVRLAAGTTELRFEGVAGGIIPQSAIVTGLPEGAMERNRDALLLSAGSLIERQLGQRVTLRRTDRATGRVREEAAVIRSGAANALVVETPAGFEALRCTGLAETIVYDGVPEGLSSTPTLSVRTRSSQPVETTVTLSYLSTNFDWQANYVAELDEAGRRIDLTAWLTLANADSTGFPDARTQAVAGRLNYHRSPVPAPEAPPLSFRCWPEGTTSDIPLEAPVPVSAVSEEIIVTGSRVMPPPPPPPPPPAPMAERGKAMDAAQEELGDLKLYRIPEQVTVAARSLKQVRFLQRRSIPIRFVYRAGWTDEGWVSARRILLMDNREQRGLGVPLPAGQLVLLGRRTGETLLLGEGSTGDKAIGEEVEVPLGEAPGLRIDTRRVTDGDREVTIANDASEPRLVEIDLGEGERGNAKRDGRPIWRITVPANATRRKRF